MFPIPSIGTIGEFLSPYKWVACAALALVIAGIGAYASYWATSAYYNIELQHEKAATAKAEANVLIWKNAYNDWKSAYGRLSATLDQQKQAVEQLKGDAVRRKAVSTEALNKANANAKAQTVAAERLRTLLDSAQPIECHAAVAAAKGAL